MVTVFTNNFEGGTDGIAISNANSGGASGTAFTTTAGGAGFKYSAADAYQGSMGAQTAAGVAGAGRVDFGAGITHVAVSMKLNMKTLNTSDTHFIRIHKSDGTRIASLHTPAPGTSSGKIRVDDSTGTTGIFTFPTAFTATQVYKVEAYFECGSTTSNGKIHVAYYIGSTLQDSVYTNDAVNLGAGLNIGQLVMGKYSTTSEAWGFDDFRWSTDATDIGQLSSNTPPTVSTPAIQNVAPATPVTVSVTASGNAGASISSYAWSLTYPSSGGPTLSGTTTNTVTFTSGSAGDLYQLQCVVTDSNSSTTTVTTEVRVPTSGDATVLPGSAAANVGTWANVGGAATPGQAMSDSSDTTYTESAVLGASEVSERFRLQPMTARSTFNLTVRLETDTSGSTSPKVRLFEGTTQRQQWSQAVTTAWGDYVLTLTSPGAITDWGNLYVEFAATSP